MKHYTKHKHVYGLSPCTISPRTICNLPIQELAWAAWLEGRGGVVRTLLGDLLSLLSASPYSVLHHFLCRSMSSHWDIHSLPLTGQGVSPLRGSYNFRGRSSEQKCSFIKWELGPVTMKGKIGMAGDKCLFTQLSGDSWTLNLLPGPMGHKGCLVMTFSGSPSKTVNGGPARQTDKHGG